MNITCRDTGQIRPLRIVCVLIPNFEASLIHSTGNSERIRRFGSDLAYLGRFGPFWKPPYYQLSELKSLFSGLFGVCAAGRRGRAPAKGGIARILVEEDILRLGLAARGFAYGFTRRI